MDAAEGNVESRLPMSSGSGRRSVNRPQLSTGDLGAGGNLDKVRDLLFGAQMRDMEKHFARLEERFQKDLIELRGCPETSQPLYSAFKPLSGDSGKQAQSVVKACEASG